MQQPLAKPLRKQLESTVVKARDVAEEAAQKALERLSIGDKSPGSHLSDEQRNLRNRLRAHGRQLGDVRKADGSQSIDHLVVEVAYEHWHRMLFARFLAENNLLMYEDGQTPLSIKDCFDLAEEEGGDGWDLAARYAAAMLPQIFRHDSPVFELAFAPEHQRALEKLLSSLEESTFHASDGLGWVYQFWQSKKKDEVNASGNKIGADELPAVTQLFTEPYMVSFLLDNSLGAWWAARRLNEADLKNAKNEEELQIKAALPGVPLEYLRFIKQENGTWTPAAGTFDGWPKHLSELKTLDPCCGSGHFLVAAFLMLVPMRMELEGLSAREAVDRVLTENIHGLELDQRCVELAVFALALTAWKYTNAGGYRSLPELHLACSGIGVNSKKEEWLALEKGNTELEGALEQLFELFKQAPVLGSLVDPSNVKSDLFTEDYDKTSVLIQEVLRRKQAEEYHEAGIVAQGMTKAAHLLAKPYDLLVTNFPFLGLERQSEKISSFIKKEYPVAKRDLATTFLARSKRFLRCAGVSAIVMPGEWTFKPSHRYMRSWLLENANVLLFCTLGRDAFETGLRVTPVLPIIKWGSLEDSDISVINLGSSAYEAKPELLQSTKVTSLTKRYWKSIPDTRFIIDASLKNESIRLGKFADARLGISAGDGVRFERNIWEIPHINSNWELLAGAVSKDKLYSGRSMIVFWENESGQIFELAQSVKHMNHAAQNWQRGRPFWGECGILISQMGGLTNYTGDIFDSRTLAVITNKKSHEKALTAFAFSGALMREVKKLDDGYKINSPRTFLDIPFDPNYWSGQFNIKFPNGFPASYSDDPKQWIFHGHPCGSVVWNEEKKWTTYGLLRTDTTVLQIAIARLLGYRWPAELNSGMELADEQREWVNRCDVLLPFVDDDGIVCLPAVRGEKATADRLEAMLQAAYGSDWSASLRHQLLDAANCKNKGLDVWLRDKFFEQHCKLFQHRPFIWHIWDGLKDGFSALVNYHKLDKKNLERLIYTYLDDWIRTQTHQKAEAIDGAEVRLQSAQNLKKRLEQILKGEAPYDIFVRWKPIKAQPIGWEPDINDGVRLNIRPFMTVEDVGKKGAGILRAKPNIHWKKDRGKDVESAPWYKLGLDYGESEGARINDHHLTIAEKELAR